MDLVFLQEIYIYAYNLLKISPAIIYSASLLAFIFTREKFYLFLFVAVMIFGDVLTHQEKKLFKEVMHPDVANRPCASITGCNKSSECGIFPRAKKNHISYGFPSGHSQIAALAVTLIAFYLVQRKKEFKYTKSTLIILCILVVLIGYQRWHSGCHTWLQIVCGWLFGILYGLILWHVIGKRIIK